MAGGPDDGAPEPIDPLTAMAASAVQMHEMYVAYCAAGFTPEQAMQLVSCILAAMIANIPPPTD